MRFFMFLLIGIIGLASVETVSARSCTEQGALCVSWAKANVPGAARQSAAMGICREEIPKCRARCKAGNKYFVGIGGSNQYPIDICN
ncbi:MULTISPECIES: hypothetical protein [Bradyrhizobium]|uniref:hypothetical protein n=1 Tax=Bradyrhizobium TaxID=374 RepID=UPI0008E58C45|nr:MULTISPECIES: hypothetical protein [Bradyrhizobium]WFU71088.1 hypothetical protein QA642_38435 [Bradyrhizobium sp. CB2312]SFV19407.1 hypothetical protein SAMN05192541_15024 [Bradyrhizobium arachidis]